MLWTERMKNWYRLWLSDSSLEKSVLDCQRSSEIKFSNYWTVQSARKVVSVLLITSEEYLILITLPLPNIFLSYLASVVMAGNGNKHCI